ncbi:hypothetical protein ABAC460_00225 [Asticcacaulis sp. AC460]|nr:hypothetical protein ABAC460_00225 [Asticcacaulis sp. AC460]
MWAGGPDNDSYYGGNSADTLQGGGGDDLINGGGGHDSVAGEDGNDQIEGGTGNDTLSGGAGDDSFYFTNGHGNDQVDGGDGTDVLFAWNTLGASSFSNVEVLTASYVTASVAQFAMFNTINFSGTLTLTGGGAVDFSTRLTSGTYMLASNSGNTITGGAFGDSIYGGNGNDSINGFDGNDQLNGSGGIDTLNGGAGNDTFYAAYSGSGTSDGGDGTDVVNGSTGLGNTTFVNMELLVANYLTAKVSQFNSFATIQVTGGLTLSDAGTVDFSTRLSEGTEFYIANAGNNLTGSLYDDRLLGAGGTDQLSGSDGNDYIFGGGGNDTLNGGAGADTFYYDYSASNDDVVDGGDGADVVDARGNLGGATFVNVEVLEAENLSATAAQYSSFAAIDHTGSLFVDGTGAVDFSTRLASGAYLVASNFGVTITSSLYDDTLEGGSGADGLFGHDGNDSISGNGGNDTLNGGAGNDSFYHWGYTTGNGAYDGGDGADVIEVWGSFGTSTVTGIETLNANSLSATMAQINSFTTITGDGFLTLTDAGTVDFTTKLSSGWYVGTQGSGSTVTGGLYDDIIYGSAGADLFNGGDGNDSLYGNGGNDTLNGGAGDDLVYYWGGDGNDSIDGGGGTDIFQISFGSLVDMAVTNFEVLDGQGFTATVAQYDGFTTIKGTGDFYISGAGTIDFTSKLDSGRGIIASNAGNTITGGQYDDYVVGGDAADSLRGGDGHDHLNGAGGNDTLIGGAGNDSFHINSGSGDDVINGGDGTDAVIVQNTIGAGTTFTAVEVLQLSEYTSYVMARPSQFNAFATIVGGEELYLTAGGTVDFSSKISSAYRIVGSNAADSITGGAFNDTVLGLGGHDSLNGGGGDDSMAGGTGNDTYVIDSAGDVIVEESGQGTDTVRSSVTFSLAGTNLEHLVLTGSGNISGTGNAGANSLTGNGSGNLLDGGEGSDTMTGGAGWDIYVVNAASDVVVEVAGEGDDLVQASASYILGDYVERLTLTGTANINGTGNSAHNQILGNSGNNVLDGAGGTDYLTGGLGNDTYYVDATTDKAIEFAGEGTDLVYASVSFVLVGTVVENLILTGTANLNATGNGVGNKLVGNSGNNVLDGGVGNDTLTGGLGDDTYYVQATGDKVVEASGEGYDVVFASATYTLTGRYAEELRLTGSANIDASGNGVSNVLVGNSGSNVLNGLGGNDSLTGGLGADTFLFGTASRADTVTDFNAVEGDMINVNAYTGGTANAGLVTQVGLNVVIDFGSGNVVTVLNAAQADVLSHMIW